LKNKDIPSLALAYLGDSVYEVYIREYLLNKGICHVKDLQKEATNFVSAKNQTKFLNMLMDNNILSDEEKDIVMRARNQHSNHKPKNTDIITYKYATGFEALIGYLYIHNQDRLNEIMNYIIGG
jgi:ribonuclease-3 family protein